jgi:hypothetical protein
MLGANGFLDSNTFAGMFDGCAKLRHVDMSSLKALYGNWHVNAMFRNCTSLETIEFPNLETVQGAYYRSNEMFKGCTSLHSLVVPKLHTFNVDSAFIGCTSLKKLYLPSIQLLRSILFENTFVEEVHFGEANEEAVRALGGFDTCFGKGAGTIEFYFDL